MCLIQCNTRLSQWFCARMITRTEYTCAMPTVWHTSEHITHLNGKNNDDLAEDSNKLHRLWWIVSRWRWKNLNIVMEFPGQRWAAQWWLHGWNSSRASSETSFPVWVFRSLVALQRKREKKRRFSLKFLNGKGHRFMRANVSLWNRSLMSVIFNEKYGHVVSSEEFGRRGFA